MGSFLKWLNDNQWLNLIFLILAIVSIIVSFYLFYKSKKKKKPQYSKRSINVISDSLHNVANVEVTYLGNKISNLTVTKIAFWNAGNDTLNFSDLASTNKLRIESVGDVTIFNSEVIYQTSPTNNITTDIKSNKINIEFDYFDKNQGGIIKIIHSGKKSSDIVIYGTFKSYGEIKELKTSFFDITNFSLDLSPRFSKKKEKKLLSRYFPKFSVILGTVLLVVYFLVVKDKAHGNVIIFALGIIYFVTGIIGTIFNKNPVPISFEAFYDDE